MPIVVIYKGNFKGKFEKLLGAGYIYISLPCWKGYRNISNE